MASTWANHISGSEGDGSFTKTVASIAAVATVGAAGVSGVGGRRQTLSGSPM